MLILKGKVFDPFTMVLVGLFCQETVFLVLFIYVFAERPVYSCFLIFTFSQLEWSFLKLIK
jgi:hypothetical protein